MKFYWLVKFESSMYNKKEFIATSTASFSSTFIQFPFVRAKLLWGGDNPKLFVVMKYSIRQEGFLSLWKGCIPDVMRRWSQQIVLFPLNDFLNRNLFQILKNKLYVLVLAGGTAAVITRLIMHPLLNARKLDKKNFKGIRDLYQGFGMVKFMSLFALYAFYFGGYYSLKKVLYQDKTSGFQKFILSAGNSTLTYWLMYRITEVRIEFEKAARVKKLGGKAPHYESVWHCAKQLYKEHGIKRLYRGVFEFHNSQQILGLSMCIFIYDLLKEWL
jgi:hypothetical protein